MIKIMQLDCNIKSAFTLTFLLFAAYSTRGNNQETYVEETYGELSPGEFSAQCGLIDKPRLAVEVYHIADDKEEIGLYDSRPVFIDSEEPPLFFVLRFLGKIGNKYKCELIDGKNILKELTHQQLYNVTHINEFVQALLIPLAELKKLITAAQ